MPHFDEEKQIKKVSQVHKQEEEDLAKMLAEKYGVSYTDLSLVAIEPEALRIVPEEAGRQALVVPFRLVEKKLFLAVHSPQKERTRFMIADLERRGFTVLVFIVSMGSLERAWARYGDLSYAHGEKAGVLEISNEDIAYFLSHIKTFSDLTRFINEIVRGEEKTHQMSRILEITLAGAMATDASDIHIEPAETRTRLRIRLDGVLHDVEFLDTRTYKLIRSRIKLVSGMKINLTDVAQDGRFSVILGDTTIEVRVSALPGTYGESVVMRLLNPKIINIPFGELGIDEFLKRIILKQLDKPNGMILTTGPTGSGKTTSLYAFMKKVYTPGLKIITIENPIEYHLTGIVQTQTDEKKGYTFFTGLKASLRQDPDIIMVGEIRDPETARTAVDAALTGHLVFSTLHTNNAAGAIPRLIGLGVNPKIIASSINIAMAQRLIRVLCKYCKKENPQTAEERKLIDSILAGIVARRVENGGTIWSAPGCEKCNTTGYKGMIGIYEGILLDNEVEQIIEANPSDREIKRASRPQGILDMREDGVLKLLKGITSLDELRRVIDMTGER
ncbi:GspE/PulE family protein [bacterium]|nr:GspE/PulE family protein [bacterium]